MLHFDIWIFCLSSTLWTHHWETCVRNFWSTLSRLLFWSTKSFLSHEQAICQTSQFNGQIFCNQVNVMTGKSNTQVWIEIHIWKFLIWMPSCKVNVGSNNFRGEKYNGQNCFTLANKYFQQDRLHFCLSRTIQHPKLWLLFVAEKMVLLALCSRSTVSRLWHKFDRSQEPNAQQGYKKW